jgi:hypothetical protein
MILFVGEAAAHRSGATITIVGAQLAHKTFEQRAPPMQKAHR